MICNENYHGTALIIATSFSFAIHSNHRHPLQVAACSGWIWQWWIQVWKGEIKLLDLWCPAGTWFYEFRSNRWFQSIQIRWYCFAISPQPRWYRVTDTNAVWWMSNKLERFPGDPMIRQPERASQRRDYCLDASKFSLSPQKIPRFWSI